MKLLRYWKGAESHSFNTIVTKVFAPMNITRRKVKKCNESLYWVGSESHECLRIPPQNTKNTTLVK